MHGLGHGQGNIRYLAPEKRPINSQKLFIKHFILAADMQFNETFGGCMKRKIEELERKLNESLILISELAGAILCLRCRSAQKPIGEVKNRPQLVLIKPGETLNNSEGEV
jgi:hypothetical protein